MNWRHRAFRFLKLYRDKNQGRSPWDIFTLRLVTDKETKRPIDNKVYVTLGQPIEPMFTPAETFSEDDLIITDEERAAMRKLDREQRGIKGLVKQVHEGPAGEFGAAPISVDDLGFGDPE